MSIIFRFFILFYLIGSNVLATQISKYQYYHYFCWIQTPHLQSTALTIFDCMNIPESHHVLDFNRPEPFDYQA